MTLDKRLSYLSLALRVFGIVFIFGIAALMYLWPSGWGWMPRQSEYEQMILGVYATLGVFLFLAAKNPLEHLSLIQFTIWSSIVHALIMLAQAIVDPTEHANMIGDIPALFLVAAVLWVLTPKRVEKEENVLSTV